MARVITNVDESVPSRYARKVGQIRGKSYSIVYGSSQKGPNGLIPPYKMGPKGDVGHFLIHSIYVPDAILQPLARVGYDGEYPLKQQPRPKKAYPWQGVRGHHG